MLILAIDCATPAAGVAIIQDETLLIEDFINNKKKHSERFMATIDRVLKECDITLSEVDVLACSLGPGSFTGLRIGLATVKGLCLATEKPVIGISTLDMLAENIYCSQPTLVSPLLNARKNEVYTAFYLSGGGNTRISEDLACSPLEFTFRARELTREHGLEEIILLGDGYNPYRELYQNELGPMAKEAPIHLMLPRAAALGNLARKRAIAGDYDDIWALRPHYLRLSEAEYRLAEGN